MHKSSCKVLVILVRFELNMKFVDIFSKNIQISNYMKICPMVDELLHADRRTDGQTDMTKLIVAFAISQIRLKLVKSTQLSQFSQNVD